MATSRIASAEQDEAGSSSKDDLPKIEMWMIDYGIPEDVIMTLLRENASTEILRCVLRFASDCNHRERQQRAIIIQAKVERDDLQEKLRGVTSSSLFVPINDFEMVKSEKEAATRKADGLSDKLTDLQKELERIQSHVRDLELCLQVEHDAVTLANAQSEQLSIKLTDKELQYSGMFSRLLKVEAEFEEQKKLTKLLADDLQAVRNSNKEAALKQAKDSCSSSVVELKKKLDDMNEEATELREKFKNSWGKCKQLQEQLQKAHAEIKGLQKQLADDQNKRRLFEKESKKYSDHLKQEIEKLTAENKELKSSSLIINRSEATTSPIVFSPTLPDSMMPERVSRVRRASDMSLEEPSEPTAKPVPDASAAILELPVPVDEAADEALNLEEALKVLKFVVDSFKAKLQDVHRYLFRHLSLLPSVGGTIKCEDEIVFVQQVIKAIVDTDGYTMPSDVTDLSFLMNDDMVEQQPVIMNNNEEETPASPDPVDAAAMSPPLAPAVVAETESKKASTSSSSSSSSSVPPPKKRKEERLPNSLRLKRRFVASPITAPDNCSSSDVRPMSRNFQGRSNNYHPPPVIFEYRQNFQRKDWAPPFHREPYYSHQPLPAPHQHYFQQASSPLYNSIINPSEVIFDARTYYNNSNRL